MPVICPCLVPAMKKTVPKNRFACNDLIHIKTTALRSGFSTERLRSFFVISCFKQSLIRACLFYPLASLDVSGQQPVSVQEPHPTSKDDSIFNLGVLYENRRRAVKESNGPVWFKKLLLTAVRGQSFQTGKAAGWMPLSIRLVLCRQMGFCNRRPCPQSGKCPAFAARRKGTITMVAPGPCPRHPHPGGLAESLAACTCRQLLCGCTANRLPAGNKPFI